MAALPQPIRTPPSTQTIPKPSDPSTLARDAPVLSSLQASHPSLAIYTRSSASWEAVRAVYNLSVTVQPLAIVRPGNEAEVSATVAAAVGAGLPVSVRSGGHDFDGRQLVSGGVTVDVRGLDWIEIATDRRTARIGGGAVHGQVARFLELHGLHAPGGFCETVGFAGWALGGGYGVHGPTYGLGVDQIVGGRVVTADGVVRDLENDEELLWMARGAGNGNLGVVTELKVKVHPTPRGVLGGLIAYPWTEAETVLKGFRQMCETDGLPRQYSGDFLFPWIPGVGVVVLALYCWTEADSDDLTKAETHLAKMRALGTPILDTVARTTPAALSAQISSNVVDAASNNYRSQSVQPWTDELIAHLLAHPVPSASGIVILHAAHGAVLDANSGASFANREPHLVIGVSRPVLPEHNLSDEELRRHDEWVSDFADGLKRKGLALDKGYANFMPDRDIEVERLFGEETTRRLRAVKRRVDPKNVFAAGYPKLG